MLGALWVARGGVEPPTFRFSVGRSFQLSYLADEGPEGPSATPTGLEPATSAVTGRHSNQLNYRSLVGSKGCKNRGELLSTQRKKGTNNGISALARARIENASNAVRSAFVQSANLYISRISCASFCNCSVPVPMFYGSLLRKRRR